MTIVSVTMSFAQLKEAHVAYSIDMSSDNPEMEAAITMFDGSSFDLYLGEEIARTELNFGAIMSLSTIANNETDEVLILMGGMMGNKAVSTSTDEMKVDDDNAPEITVTITDDEKQILNYACKKAIITDIDGNEMVFWFTESISPNIIDKSAPISMLPGLALEYSIDQSGMLMTFTANKVETEIDEQTKNNKFNLAIPDGFDEITYEEFASMGAM